MKENIVPQRPPHVCVQTGLDQYNCKHKWVKQNGNYICEKCLMLGKIEDNKKQ